MAKRQTARMKAVDRFVEYVVSKRCNGIQINIMDIGKVFLAAEVADAAGKSNDEIEQVVVETYRSLAV